MTLSLTIGRNGKPDIDRITQAVKRFERRAKDEK
jgi:hypothetical protein